MTDSQFAMQQCQVGSDWNRQRLKSLAASQGSNADWLAPVGNTPVLNGVVNSGNINNDWNWHYAKVKASADAEVAFEVPPGMTIGLVYEGELSLEIAGAKHTLKVKRPTAFCFANEVPALLKRKFRAGRIVHKFTLGIRRAWLNAMELDVFIHLKSHQLVTFAATDSVIAATQALVLAPKEGHMLQKLEQMAWVHTLLTASADAVVGAGFTPAKPAEVKTPVLLEQRLLERVREIIQRENILLEDIQIDALAKSLGASVSGIQRMAKKCFGQSLLKHIRQAKLANALRAMRERHLTIGEAAFLAGYKHPSNFSLAFKKAYGVPPGELLGPSSPSYAK